MAPPGSRPSSGVSRSRGGGGGGGGGGSLPPPTGMTPVLAGEVIADMEARSVGGGSVESTHRPWSATASHVAPVYRLHTDVSKHRQAVVGKLRAQRKAKAKAKAAKVAAKPSLVVPHARQHSTKPSRGPASQQHSAADDAGDMWGGNHWFTEFISEGASDLTNSSGQPLRRSSRDHKPAPQSKGSDARGRQPRHRQGGGRGSGGTVWVPGLSTGSVASARSMGSGASFSPQIAAASSFSASPLCGHSSSTLLVDDAPKGGGRGILRASYRDEGVLESVVLNAIDRGSVGQR